MSSALWHTLNIGCTEELAGTKTMEKTMKNTLNLLDSMLASMGLCWPLLEAMLVHFGGYDGPSWVSSHMSSACWHILDIGCS